MINKEIDFEFKKLAYEEFKKSIINLRKAKNMINYSERLYTLKLIQNLTLILTKYKIEIESEKDLSLFLLNLKSLVNFESHRFLI